MAKNFVLALCNLTTNFCEPWEEAGYTCVMVDPQHSGITIDGGYVRRGETVLEAMPVIRELIQADQIAFVAGFPPCTDMAVSGARWFEHKRKQDAMFQAKAVAVAEQCRAIGMMSGAPWFVEQPVSVLSSVWGKPDYTFHPSDYTMFEPEDNYTKKTCLWTGGGFVMPKPSRAPNLPPPDDRIHKAPPSVERANIRSATPRGFSLAVCLANHKPHILREPIPNLRGDIPKLFTRKSGF